MQGKISEFGDKSRETPRRFYDPSRKLIKSIRDYQKGNILTKKIAVIRHTLWSIVTGADIPLNTRIGIGLMIPHPQGVVIHPDTEIGCDCMIMQGVTLGSNGKDERAPALGNNVFIGPNSVVVGGVVIPHGKKISALSFVKNS